MSDTPVSVGNNTSATIGNGSYSVTAGSGDQIAIGNGNNTITAGSNDKITVGNGNDNITIGSNDNLTVGNGNDTITAGTNDVITAGNGNDTITAGNNSTVAVGNGNQTVTVGNTSSISAGDGNKTLTAGTHSSISAGNGNNTVYASSYDTVTLGNGNDTVYMSSNDTVTVGNGNSLFIFQSLPEILSAPSALTVNEESSVAVPITIGNSGFGNDVIVGFSKNDQIQLDTSQFADFTHAVAAATQVGADTVIRVDSTDTITLKNVQKSSLTAKNFVFVTGNANNTAVSITISGIPSDVTLSDGAGALSVVNGSVTLTPAQLAGLTLHAGEDKTATLTVTATSGSGVTATSVTQTIALTINAVPPTIVTGSTTASGAVTERTNTTGSTVADGATGTIAFADVDPSATYTASSAFTGAVWHKANGTSVAISDPGGLTLAAINQSAKTLGWTYSAVDRALDFLAAGETITLSYNVTIAEAGEPAESVTQAVTVTITGTNDAPVITSSAAAASGAFSERSGVTGSTATDSATGTIAFADVDLNNTHTLSQSALGFAWNGGTLSAGQLAALTSASSLTLTEHDSTGTGAGSVGWSYAAADDAFDFLAAGEKLTVTQTVTVTDNNGASAAQLLTITISGANDAPTITSGTGAASGTFTELANTTGSTATDNATGTITFADVDLNDTHTLSQNAVSFAWTGGSLSAGQLAALTGASSLTLTEHDSTGTGAGSVRWSYVAADDAFDFLAAGEKLTVTQTVTVTDNHGAAGSQLVTVTITGTNDAPMISAHTDGAVTEDTSEHGNLLSSGTVGFSDVDLTDTHSSVTVTPAGTPLGTLTAQLTTDTTGNGLGGVVTWSYSVADDAVDYLAAGQTKVEHFSVTVADNHGGTASQDIAVTITGSNESPVITSHSDGAVTEDTTEHGNLTDSGTVGFSDVDLSDTHSHVSIAPVGSPLGTLTAQLTTDTTGNGLGGVVTWSYSVADDAVDYLAAGQTKVEHFSVTVADNHGGTASQDIAVTITGSNEAPVITSHSDGAVTEDTSEHGNLLSSGAIGFGDVDLTDTHSSVTVMPVGSPLGTLTAQLTTDTTGTGLGGVVTWSYSIADDAVDYLAAGQTKVEHFSVTVADNNGGTASQDIAVTITGSNEAPVITSHSDGAVTEDTSEHGNLLSSGAIGFGDVDLTDTHSSVTVTPAGTPLGTLTAQLTTDTTGSGSGGVVTWSYSVADDAVDYLAAGQTKVEHFSVTVADNHGGTASQDIAVTITGSNEAPVITSHSDGAVTEDTTEHGNLTDSGAIGFGDVDLTDTHSSVTVMPVGSPLGTLTAQLTTDTTGTGLGGVVTWSYSIADDAVDYLAAGQTKVEHFSVTVADNNGGTASQDIAVTITGSNEAPVITSHTDGAVTEDTSEHGNLLSSGTVGFSDVDLIDTHSSVTVTPAGTPLGTLTAQLTTDTTGSGRGGVVTWSYSVADDAVDYLAAGQTKVEHFSVTVADNHGGTASQDIAVTITGSNESPVITSHSDGAVTEDTSEHGNLTDSGSIGFGDVDLTDTHSSVTVMPVGSPLGTLTAQLTTDTTGTGLGGVVTWSYSVADDAVDYLAAGQTKVEHFSVTVADNNGGTASQDIAVTITGSNEAPVITSHTDGAVTEDTSEHGNLLSSGTVGFSDVDLTDTHSSVTVTPAGTPLGTLTAQLTTDTTGNGLGGVVTWSYSVADDAVDYLAAGQTKVEHFSVTVADNHGGTASQDIAVTITGTNESPVITSHSDGAVTEDTSEHGNLTDSGSIGFGDVDLSDTHSNVTVDPVGSPLGGLTAHLSSDTTGSGSGGVVTWSYSVADDAVDYLAAGQTKVEHFSVTVADNNGGTASQDIAVTITGTNDAPVLTASNPALSSIDENASGNGGQTVASFLGSSISDPDAGAVQGIAITATDSSIGIWQYSLNAGSTWSNVGAVSATSALLLRPSDYVRLVSNDAEGPTSFSYRAWDQTSGSAGAKVDASNNGGSTAFSTSTDTTHLMVTGVADKPQVSAAASNTSENAGAITLTGLSVAAGDSSASDQTDTFTVTLSVTQGTLSLGTQNGATVTFSGMLGDVSTALAAATYTPSPEFEGTDTLTLSATATEEASVGGNTSAVASTSTSITVTGVADVPVVSAPAGKTLNENGAVGLTGLSVAAGDASSNDALDTFNVTLGVANGSLSVGGAHTGLSGTFSGASVSFSGSRSNVNAALTDNNITYTPTSEFEGNDTLTFQASTTEDFGVSTSATATQTASLTVNGVADVPAVSTPANVITTENATNVAITGLSVSTLDGSANDNADSFTAIVSVGNGTLAVDAHGSATLSGNNSGVVMLTGSLSDVTIGLGHVSYTPTPEFQAVDTLSFSATSTDGASTSAVASSSASITVNPVSEGPVLGGAPSSTVNEGGAVAFGVTDTVLDTDDTLGNVSITGLPHDLTNVNGGTYTAGTGSWIGSAAQFGALTFNAGEQGTFNLSISAATTGTEAGTTTGSYTLTVNAVSEGPVLDGTTSKTVNEGGAVTLGATDTTSDTDDLLGNVTITGLPNDLTNVTGGSTYTASSGTWTGTAAQFNVLSFNVGEQGTFNLSISAATMGTEAGTTTGSYSLTVNPVAEGPMLGGTSSKSVNEGGAVTFGATDTASDTDDTLGNVSISGLPTDLTNVNVGTYTASSGIWTGTAAQFGALTFNAGEQGTFALSISATTTGAEAGTTTGNYTLTVNPVSEPPVLTLPVAGAPSFQISSVEVGAGGPLPVAVADFNGDGKLDLVVGNHSANDVAVLLGNGDGTFGAPTTFTAGSNPHSVAIGDFNGDGKLDLAVADYTGDAVSVLLGNGNGTFAAATSYAVGVLPYSVVAGDFNNDGKLDLAVANEDSNNVSLLLGNGNGTFGAAASYAVGSEPFSVTTGDFNGDGKPDLAVANGGTNTVSVLLNSGNGTFASAGSYTVGSGLFSVTTGDFNGDGKLDLAVATQSSVSVLLGNGDGSFGAPVNYGSGLYVFPDVTTADINGDGKLDLVVTSYSGNTVSVLLGNGNGSFGAATQFTVGSEPFSAATGDLNGDGKVDLVVANSGSTNVSVLLNTELKVNEGGTLRFGGTVAAADSDDTLGSVSISGLPTDLSNFNGGTYTPGTGTWSGMAAQFNALTFTAGEQGSFNLSISATTTGTETGTTTGSYSLTVNPVAEGPILGGTSSKSVNEGGAVTFGATDTASDTDDTQGSVSITGLPTDLTNVNGGTYGGSTWTGTAAQFNALTFTAGEQGTFSLSISAATTGTETGTTTGSYSLTVNPVAEGPVLGGTSSKAVNEGGAVTFGATDTASDTDDTLGNVSITGLPTDLTNVNGGTYGGSTWTGTAAQFNALTFTAGEQGTFSLSISAATTGTETGTTTGSYSLTVNPVAEGPVLGGTSSKAVNEGGAVTFGATDTASDTDDTLGNVSITGLPTDLTNVNGGTYSGSTWTGTAAQFNALTFTAGEQGTFNLSISAVTTGTEAGATAGTYTLTVNPVAEGPILGGTSSKAVNEGGAVTFGATDTASDTDDTLGNVSITGLPTDLTNVNGGAYSGSAWTGSAAQFNALTFTAGEQGTFNLSISAVATGTEASTSTESYTLAVNPVSEGPVLGGTTSKTVIEGGAVILGVTDMASDADDALGNVTITGLPNDLTNVAGGGTYTASSGTWTGTAAQFNALSFSAGEQGTFNLSISTATTGTEAGTTTGSYTLNVVTALVIVGPFTTLDATGLANTQAIGINNAGQIVGQGDLDSQHQRGWLYNGTTFSVISAFGAQDTSADGINNSGVIVGYYSPVRSTPRYAFVDTNGSFVQLVSDSQGASTTANSINDAGVVVGSAYLHPGTRYAGFMYNGSFTYLVAPGANNSLGDTFAQGINNNGQIVGSFNPNASNANGYEGFLYQNGTYTTIADPLGVKGTFANGINDAGQIVGWYDDANGVQHGFVDVNGVFTTIDDPLGAHGTVVNAINNAGQIVGYYIDGNNANHGFLASLAINVASEGPVLAGATSKAVNQGGPVTLGATDTTADSDDTLGNVTITGLPTDLTGFNGGTYTAASGTWTGTAAQFNALAFTAGSPGTFNLSIYASTSGVEAGTTSGSYTLTVNTVVVAPVISTPASASTNEDSALTLSGASAITATLPPLDAGDNLAMSLSVAHGTLALGNSSGVTVTSSGSTLAFNGSQSAVSAALASGVVYTPGSEYEGSDTLTVTGTAKASNGTTATSSPQSVALTINPYPEVPTLAAQSVTVNEGGTVGLSISDTLSETDADATLGNILLTGVPAGVTFNQGNLSNGTLTLTTGQLSGLTMTVPDSDQSFTLGVSASASEGSGTATANTSLAVTVTPVADAPSVLLNAGSLSTNESTPLVINGITFASAANDGDDAFSMILNVGHGTLALGSSSGLSITSNGLNGTLAFSGSAAAISAALASGVTYNPGDYEGSDTLTVTGTATEQANGNSASTTQTLALTVNGIADTPAVSAPANKTTTENSGFIALSGLSVASHDPGTSDDGDTYNVTLGVAHGTLVYGGPQNGITGTFSGPTISFSGSLASVNAALTASGFITYAPNSEFEGSDTLTLSATSTEEGGATPSAAASSSASITVAGAPEAPTVTAPATGPTIAENSTTPVALTGVSVGPLAEDGDDTVSARLETIVGKLTVGSATGATVFRNNTNDISVTGSAAAVNTVLAGLTYTAMAEYEGSETLEVIVTSSDGGVLYPTTAVSFTSIGYTQVAEQPSITTPANVTTSENTSNVALGGMTISTDGSATDNADTFSATVSVGHGTLAVGAYGSATLTGGGTASVTLTGTLGDVNTGLGNVAYTPAPEFQAIDTLTFSAKSIEEGGSISTTASSSASITVNGLPAITVPGAQSIGVSKAATITGISVSESGNTTGETFTATVSNTNGVLTATGGTQSNGNHTLTFSGLSLTALNSDLATVSDTDGTTGADTITVNASDSFNNSATAQTIAMTVNGLPVITVPGAKTIGVGKAATISGVSVSETGNTTGETFTATVSDTNGVLTATGGTQSNGNHTLTFSGLSLTALNSDLTTLSDTDGTTGSDTITVNASDSFNNSATATTIAVTVNSVPSITVPGAQTIGAGKAATITGISVSETGNTTGSETFTATVSDTNGVLTATGGTQSNGNHTLTFSGLSLTALNSDLATLSDTDGTTGSDTITVNASDSFGNSATATTIAVTVNSAPSITVPGAKTIGVGKAATISGVSVSETGNTTGSETFTATVSDTNGVLTATGGTQSNGGHTLTFTGLALPTLNSDLATLSDTDGTTGSDTITVNASDSFGNSATAKTVAMTVNALPVITAPAAQTIGVGKAATISGVSVSETGNTTGETFTATVSDTNGVLTATGGTQSNGGHTLTFTGLALPTLNSDLATLSDTDGTTGSDTITVNASDSFGNSATAKTVAMTVNALPVITAPAAQTIGVGKAATISGISVSETGNTTGETFTATVSDTNGVLTATGGTQSNGGHTLTFSGVSLTTLNSDLATLSGTDGTTGSDTITVNATDSFGNSATAKTVAVTVNGLPAITAPAAQTIGVGTAATISGVSMSETGNTTGSETFTATVSDTNGVLTATGGTQSNGGHTLTFSGVSLTTLNSDLATLSDTDGTAGSDTITLNASDSFSNSATQQMIAVTAQAPNWAGDTLTAYYLFPNSGTVLYTSSFGVPATGVLGLNYLVYDPEGTFQGIISDYISVSNNTITFSTSSNPNFYQNTPAAFNGFEIVDDTRNPSISSVTIDPSVNFFGLSPSNISFTSSAVFVNWQGFFFSSGTIVQLDLGFDPPLDPSQFTGGSTLDGSTTPVSNPGTLTVPDGSALTLAGTIDNSGSIDLNASTAPTAILVNGDVKLTGGGQINLSQNNQNYIAADADGDTLTNVDNTISGGGDIGNGTLAFHNAGVLAAGGSYALLIDTGSNTFVNTGMLQVTDGTLMVRSPEAGGGSALLSGGTLEYFGAAADNVSFAGDHRATLYLHAAEAFTGSISGFGGADQIDLADIGFGASTTLGYTASGDNSGGTLTVDDGTSTANIALLGSYMAASFAAASDGHGGTLITAASQQPASDALVTPPH